MSLYDEEKIKKESNKMEKYKKIVLILMIFFAITVISVFCLMYYLATHPDKTTVYLGTDTGISRSQELEKIISVQVMNDGTYRIYAPIKDIAPILKYQTNNGEYTIVSEDTNSCYIENENEVAIFKLDSDIIYKKDLTTNSEYESFSINVFSKKIINYVYQRKD